MNQWRSENVLAICKQMRATHDYGALPILADALESEGCDYLDLLKKMRGRKRSGADAWRLVCLVESDESTRAVCWIEDFADEIDQGYNALMEAAERWAESGNYTFTGDNEGYKDVNYNQWPIFWKNYQIVMGKSVDTDTDGSFFSCAC